MHPREWQIIISDGKTSIKQLYLSKYVGYSIGVLVSTSLLSVGMMVYVISQQATENEALQSHVQELNQRFQTQHEKILQYEEEKHAIARQLIELRALEEQMNDLVSELNPGRIAAISEGPQGGLEEGLVKSSEFKINRDYSSISEEFSKLVASYQTAVQDINQVTQDLKRTPIHWPADTEVVSSAFGYRTDPFTNVSSFHGGIDLAGPLDTEIYSTGHGVVEFAGWNGAYGKSVLINH